MIKNILTSSRSISVDFGVLFARVCVGAYFIFHGHELFYTNAMESFASYLSNDLHFPMPLLMAYLRTGAELFGGIMILFGLLTRIGSFLIMFTILAATFTIRN
jgi:putative oxidoreductase